MTDRDTFAVAALNGILSFGLGLWPKKQPKEVALLAYQYADALIAARDASRQIDAPNQITVEQTS